MKVLLLLFLFSLVLCFSSCSSEDTGDVFVEGCTSSAHCPVGWYCDVAKARCLEKSDLPDSDAVATGDSDSSVKKDADSGGNIKPDVDQGKPDTDTPSYECTSTSNFCIEADRYSVYRCNDARSDVVKVEDCDTENGELCLRGKCATLCGEIDSSGGETGFEKSYNGCEYFAVNLQNLLAGRRDPIFTVSISNTHEVLPVKIDVTFTDAGEAEEKDAGKIYFCKDKQSVDSCQLLTSALGLRLEPKQLGLIMFEHHRMVQYSGISFLSYHITTTVPVSVYQFNPFDNSAFNPFTENMLSVDSNNSFQGKMYSNDASLLLPATSLYTDYVAATFNAFSVDAPAFVTIVGVSENDTEISVTPSAKIRAGAEVPEMNAGGTHNFTLKKHQVITLSTADVGSDLTGTRVTCRGEGTPCYPFAVFSGNTCADLPVGRHYCDHLEQQMFPVQTWGKNYALVKMKPRAEEPDFVRIIPWEDGTNITFLPNTPQAYTSTAGDQYTSEPAKTLINRGEFSEFYFKEPLFIQADKPVMVVQYLTGSETLSSHCKSSHDDSCIGDPAMMLIPPAEQFREEYIFFNPGSYQNNFATVVWKTGIVPNLDGATVTGGISIAGTEYLYSVVDLGSEFKRHTLVCTENGEPGQCGLFTYGWEKDVSYAYPGGLNLKNMIQH